MAQRKALSPSLQNIQGRAVHNHAADRVGPARDPADGIRTVSATLRSLTVMAVMTHKVTKITAIH
jgi:hypothetical protein